MISFLVHHPHSHDPLEEHAYLQNHTAHIFLQELRKLPTSFDDDARCHDLWCQSQSSMKFVLF